MLFFCTNASLPVLSSSGMGVEVGVLRNNIWPVFLLEKDILTYSHSNLDLEDILDPVHLHVKGEES